MVSSFTEKDDKDIISAMEFFTGGSKKGGNILYLYD